MRKYPFGIMILFSKRKKLYLKIGLGLLEHGKATLGIGVIEVEVLNWKLLMHGFK